MQQLAWVLLNPQCDGTFTAFSPDINAYITAEDGSIYMDKNLIPNRLSEFFLSHSVLYPKNYEELYSFECEHPQYWKGYHIELLKSKRSLAYLLPTLGYILNTYNLMSGAFVTFMALQITGTSNSKDHIYISAAGAILNFIFNVIIYVYSDAGMVLGKLGWKIDQTICSSLRAHENNVISDRSSYAQQIAALFILIAILLNVTIAAIKLIQEHKLLKLRFLDQHQNISDQQRQMYNDMIDWFVIYLGIAAGIYCAIAFQASFAIKMHKRYFARETLRREEAPILYAHAQVVGAAEHQDGYSSSASSRSISRARNSCSIF